MAYTMKDICCPRKGKDGKTHWHRVGTAFLSDDGKIGLQFDSLPMPDGEGRCTAQIFDRKDKDDASPRRAGQYQGDHPAKGLADKRADIGDEEIPF